MKLIVQPIDSRICGHCCVSMLSGVNIEKVIETIGHSNGTYGKDLIRCFQALGVKTANKLKFPLNEKDLPEAAILRIKIKDRIGGHWVVLYKGYIYDPSFRYDCVEYNHYKEEFLRDEARFISYLKVLK